MPIAHKSTQRASDNSNNRRCNRRRTSRLAGGWLVLLVILGVLQPGTLAAQHPQTASALFERLRDRVYQIRVIDLASGDKTTIGSGFLVDDRGTIATNFHVVQLLVDEPEQYRLELAGDRDKTLAPTVIAVDVLHDLALLRADLPDSHGLGLLASELARGERVYAMGNPRDLGMTIVEGNYNGLVKTSRFQRLLFSGSLNPGMSGGPAINERGEVIGINVATGGEQLSFLVPVKFLNELLRANKAGHNARTLSQQVSHDLLNEQEVFYRQRLAQPWPKQTFGELNLPHELSPAMKCWGHKLDDDDDQRAYQAIHQHCRSEEYLFLNGDFYTGNFAYDFEWMSTAELNRLQFYTAVEKRFTHTSHGNAYDESDVSNQSCESEFVEIDHSAWKASICLRSYNNHRGLHDASLVMVSLRHNRQAAIIKMAATGIAKGLALEMFEKLMRSITWIN